MFDLYTYFLYFCTQDHKKSWVKGVRAARSPVPDKAMTPAGQDGVRSYHTAHNLWLHLGGFCFVLGMFPFSIFRLYLTIGNWEERVYPGLR